MNALAVLYAFAVARGLTGHLSEASIKGCVDVHPRKDPVLALEAKRLRIPHPVKRSGTKAYAMTNTLFESEKYLFATDGTEQYCWDLAEQVLQEAGDDEALAAVRTARRRIAAGLASALLKQAEGSDSTGWILLRMAGEDHPIFARKAVAKYLKAQYATSLKPAKGSQDFCLVTGEPSAIPKDYKYFSNVPGGNSSGAALLSWNADAYEYAGRSSARNFTVGVETDAAIQQAQRYLYGVVSPGVLRCAAAFGEAHSVCWICEDDDLPFLQTLLHRPVSLLNGSDSKDKVERWNHVRSRLEQAWAQVEESKGSESAVSIVALRGERGRCGITDAEPTTVGAVCRSLLRFRKAFGDDPHLSVADAVHRFHERRTNDEGFGETLLSGRDMVQLALVAVCGRPIAPAFAVRMQDAPFRPHPAPDHFRVQAGWLNMVTA